MEDNFYSGKTSKFFKFYRIYVIIVTVLLIGALVFLWIKLAGFQKNYENDSLDKLAKDQQQETILSDEERQKIAQQCFENYMSNITADDWVQIWYAQHPDRLDEPESVEQFIVENITGAGYEYYKAPDFSIDTPVYYMITGKMPLVKTTLVAEGLDYKVDSCEILLDGSESLSAQVPDDCAMILNGSEVLPEYIVTSGQEFTLDGYEEELENPVKYNTYDIEGLCAVPDIGDIKVKCESGEAALSVDGKFYKTLDMVNGLDYQNKAEAFIKSLLEYYTRGKENAESNMNSVLSHVKSSSKAAKVINDSYSGIVWTTADTSINYVLTHSDVYIVADNCYCVDIEYRDDNSEDRDKSGGVYRVYFLDDGNGYAIVNFAGIQ